MTPHIESDVKDIAKTVIMPGDPLRAKMIAEKYLTDVKQVNSVRNIFAYTGYYKEKKVTVFASGMGNASMGIYSYELFKFYDVDNIIRVGSCGSYKENLDLYEVILVDKSYSNSNYLYDLMGNSSKFISSSEMLNRNIISASDRLNIPMHFGNIHCTDVFYNSNDNISLSNKYNLLGVEMETFALFSNAYLLGKNASCILTVSDNLITKKETTSLERQNSFNKMIELALESI